MKLYECCDIGYCMGLNTIGEAISNVKIHATNLFEYDNICNELRELEADLAASPYEPRMSLIEVIGEDRAAEIDKEIEDYVESQIFDDKFFTDVDGNFMDENFPF